MSSPSGVRGGFRPKFVCESFAGRFACSVRKFGKMRRLVVHCESRHSNRVATKFVFVFKNDFLMFLDF